MVEALAFGRLRWLYLVVGGFGRVRRHILEDRSASAVAPDSESPDCWRAVICLRCRWPLANDLRRCTSRTTVATRSIDGRFASIDWSQISPRGDATLQTVPAEFPAWLTAHALAAVVLAIGVK